jgi:organic hydroperoxide reductase OsmC/OhrA
MQALPHRYHVRAQGGPAGTVQVSASGLAALATQPPPEFGGPEGFWSPETLLAGAIVDCYVLSFRAIARASKLEWQDLRVDVEAVLDRVDGVTRFTEVRLQPRLRLAAGASETLARTVLQKAKASCLITNSLTATCTLEPVVETEGVPA